MKRGLVETGQPLDDQVQLLPRAPDPLNLAT